MHQAVSIMNLNDNFHQNAAPVGSAVSASGAVELEKEGRKLKSRGLDDVKRVTPLQSTIKVQCNLPASGGRGWREFEAEVGDLIRGTINDWHHGGGHFLSDRIEPHSLRFVRRF
jgi:hypothetical protein